MKSLKQNKEDQKVIFEREVSRIHVDDGVENQLPLDNGSHRSLVGLEVLEQEIDIGF
jgi:hypothetical protein